MGAATRLLTPWEAIASSSPFAIARNAFFAIAHLLKCLTNSRSKAQAARIAANREMLSAIHHFVSLADLTNSAGVMTRRPRHALLGKWRWFPVARGTAATRAHSAKAASSGSGRVVTKS